ncbi:OmpP1/FadL family transporter [Paracoccus marinus]|uniref:OmpP1/FadL family transporter n=1 Tax=Paracoccus marinus TaxID=288426 RepID=UPI00117F7BB9|nr:outer membrane protein transport protein [Paracoccus marinus]GLS80210.1 membrane protein [Paracoccus marinus]
MKKTLTASAVLMLGAAPLMAGGIERAPQSLGALFEPGNYVELSFGKVNPDVSGRDVAIFGGRDTGGVADDYGFVGFAYKQQLQDNLSVAFIVEQPYGTDIKYPVGESVALGGTSAEVNSTTYTALLRYTMDNGFGVHGGLRGSRVDAEVNLRGLAYGPISGYNLKVDDDWAAGYVVGVSYEKPEIAARVSLTYNSDIEHEFDTRESLSGFPLGGESRTKVHTPRSWNLEGQTGVAPGTLVFGSIRWVKWSEFKVNPAVFVAAPPAGFGISDGLVDLEDTTTFTLGVGRKFTDNWSGAASFSYEKAEDDDLVSPLAPTNGRKGISLAAIYTQDKFKVTTGISYFKLGDASAETGTPDTARAEMEDNHALGVGVKIGYTF